MENPTDEKIEMKCSCGKPAEYFETTDHKMFKILPNGELKLLSEGEGECFHLCSDCAKELGYSEKELEKEEVN